jgi:hypothetical protein
MSSGIPPANARSTIRLLIAPLAVIATLAASILWIVFYLADPQSVWNVLPRDLPFQFTVPHHVVDVTAKLRAEIAGNRLTMVANNDRFGDPAPGIVKKLRVEYSIDSSPGVRTISENSTLVIAAAPGKTLEIRKAVYGDLPDQNDQIAPGDIGRTINFMDVAQILRDGVHDNQLTIKAGNNVMGGDPAFGEPKILAVEYTVGGKPHTVTIGENDVLSIPAKGDGAGSLVIVKANWAAARQMISTTPLPH